VSSLIILFLFQSKNLRVFLLSLPFFPDSECKKISETVRVVWKFHIFERTGRKMWGAGRTIQII